MKKVLKATGGLCAKCRDTKMPPGVEEPPLIKEVV